MPKRDKSQSTNNINISVIYRSPLKEKDENEYTRLMFFDMMDIKLLSFMDQI